MAIGTMTALALGLGALGGAGGALAGRSKTGSQTSTTNQTQTSTTTPVEQAPWTELRDTLLQRALTQLQQPAPIAGYEALGLNNINDTYRLGQQRLSNSLTSRGLSTSPVAGAGQATLETARGGDILSFLNNLPLLERSLKLEDMGQAMNLFGMRPIGSTTTGNMQGSTVGSYTTPGNVAGGAMSGFSSMLGWLLGSGALGQKKTTGPYSV